MPNPKRRHSNQRTRKRRTHDKVHPASSSLCQNCQAPKRAHQICPACGYYRGRPVISIKQKAAKRKA